MKTEYVCGFLFDENFESVVLINKNKPEWQKGKLNGVGGKIEPNETPADAMSREFREEASLDLDPETWNEFAEIIGEGWIVHFFHNNASLTKSIPFLKKLGIEIHASILKSMTDEKIEVLDVEDIQDDERVIPNLRWLIPMALDEQHAFCRATAK